MKRNRDYTRRTYEMAALRVVPTFVLSLSMALTPGASSAAISSAFSPLVR